MNPSSSIFSSAHDQPSFDASLQEEQLKHMLKFSNYHELAFKDMLETRLKANCAGSAFNLVNKDYRPMSSQLHSSLHSSMLSDEAFAEDLSDNSPAEEECMSDEQMSDDEQPLDFSIKSKKEDHEPKSASAFAARSSMDQVDGDRATRLGGALNAGHSSKYHHSAMFNSSFTTHHPDYEAVKFFAPNSSKLAAGQASSGGFPNRFPFMNPLLLGESQASLIHSEPSSPEGEGLSSASSTSSRSSSQGYYSGSSLSGAAAFSLPNALSQSIAPSIYSPSLFNQSPLNQSPLNQSPLNQSPLNKSPSYMQTAPPSYASLNFTNSTATAAAASSSSGGCKQAFARNSNGQCQQSRPSVIVSNSKTASSSRSSALFPVSCKKDAPVEIEVVDSIDEHFRLSLGSDYKKINSQSTPTKKVDTLKSNSFAKKQTAGRSIYLTIISDDSSHNHLNNLNALTNLFYFCQSRIISAVR